MNHTHNPYLRLFWMVLLSFGAMYVLMYAMVNAFGNVFNNINQVYMAGLMAAPMALIELGLMGMMYPNKKLNNIVALASVTFAILFFLGIRVQFAVGDEEFLKSMVPHHAGAILMCNEAQIEDAEIKKLCESIVESQQAEIDWMKNKLNQFE